MLYRLLLALLWLVEMKLRHIKWSDLLVVFWMPGMNERRRHSAYLSVRAGGRKLLSQ